MSVMDLSSLGFCIYTISIYCKVANSSTPRLAAHPRIFRSFIKVKWKAYFLWPFWEKMVFAIVARSTVRDSTEIILKGVVNFLLNRILLSQVHARARKHTDTHKLACKSSLVRIRYPLSWENIWPHILFFKIRASRSPAADHVCVCIYTLQYTNE